MREEDQLIGCTFHPHVLSSPYQSGPSTLELNNLAKHIALEMNHDSRGSTNNFYHQNVNDSLRMNNYLQRDDQLM
jgi:hypothetical protein